MKKEILSLGTSFGHVIRHENPFRHAFILNTRNICQAFNSPFRIHSQPTFVTAH